MVAPPCGPQAVEMEDEFQLAPGSSSKGHASEQAESGDGSDPQQKAEPQAGKGEAPEPMSIRTGSEKKQERSESTHINRAPHVA